jgi:hypothetical protein
MNLRSIRRRKMIERVSIAQVKNWGMKEFVDYGYDFIIQLERFGDEVLPVIHIRNVRSDLIKFDFPIILEEYEPKDPNSSEFNYGDKVTVDFELFEKIFREEKRKLRGVV